MGKECNHKWQDFGAYKKCLVCGQVIMSGVSTELCHWPEP